VLTVTIEEAEPGMRLAVNIHHPENPAQDLLRRGFVLDKKVIGRLRGLGIDTLYVDYPGLEDLDRHLAPFLSPVRQQLYTQIKATIAAVQKTAKPTVGFADYYFATREFLFTLMQQGEHPVYLEVLSSRLGDDAVAHGTTVAHLSLLLAIRLRRYLIEQRHRLPPEHAAEVINAGVAGMLHDLGKVKLPPELQRFSDVRPPDDEDQRKQWQEHARIGYDMTRGGIEASASAAILQTPPAFRRIWVPHDARPGRQASRPHGPEDHIFARILIAANVFDRLAYAPDSPRRRPNFQTLNLLRRTLCAMDRPGSVQGTDGRRSPVPAGDEGVAR